MDEKRKFKGPWIQQFAIVVLGITLGVLLFWLLGFVTNDIDSLPKPNRSTVRAKHVNPDLDQTRTSLKQRIVIIRNVIREKQRDQQILKDSTKSLQNTINQLLSLEKQNRPLSPRQQETLEDSQALFLDNQKKYQALSEQIAELTRQQRKLDQELTGVSKQIAEQEIPAGTEYDKLMARHRWKLAALKLAVIIPVFLITAWVFVKKRSGTYWPLAYAAFITAFLRLGLIVHEYFHRKYFKYIALLVIIGIVLRLLVYLLRMIIHPKKASVVKQYQEAYDNNACPVCHKPIRTGPLRYAVLRKRKPVLPAGQGGPAPKQEPYSCPSCGTELYEKCDKCSDIRHSLLPYCEHCGAAKEDWAGQVKFSD